MLLPASKLGRINTLLTNALHIAVIFATFVNRVLILPNFVAGSVSPTAFRSSSTSTMIIFCCYSDWQVNSCLPTTHCSVDVLQWSLSKNPVPTPLLLLIGIRHCLPTLDHLFCSILLANSAGPFNSWTYLEYFLKNLNLLVKGHQ